MPFSGVQRSSSWSKASRSARVSTFRARAKLPAFFRLLSIDIEHTPRGLRVRRPPNHRLGARNRTGVVPGEGYHPTPSFRRLASRLSRCRGDGVHVSFGTQQRLPEAVNMISFNVICKYYYIIIHTTFIPAPTLAMCTNARGLLRPRRSGHRLSARPSLPRLTVREKQKLTSTRGDGGLVGPRRVPGRHDVCRPDCAPGRSRETSKPRAAWPIDSRSGRDRIRSAHPWTTDSGDDFEGWLQ